VSSGRQPGRQRARLVLRRTGWSVCGCPHGGTARLCMMCGRPGPSAATGGG